MGKRSRGPARAWVVLVLCLAGFDRASAAVADWDLRLALEERYDDNIIQLSDRDRRRLESGSSTANRFSIETADDLVSIPQISAGLEVEWLRGLPSGFQLDAAAYRYARNPVKDYESYRLTARQTLHHGRRHPTTIEVSAAVLPDFYLRNLISDRASEEQGILSVRLEATYRKETIQLQMEQEIVHDRLRFEGTWGRERRDYNRNFDERDSQVPFRAAELSWDPLGVPRLRVRLSYRREDLHAGGDLADTSSFIEDDVSSRRDILVGEARLRWGEKARRKSLRLRHEVERRDFSTADANDIFHFDRDDRRRYTTLAWRAELKSGWFVSAEAERHANRSDFPATPGSTFDPDDTTDYDETLVAIAFGREISRAGGGKRPPHAAGP